MVRLTLIVHERLAIWARRLRLRIATWPVRLVESRSANDLAAAIATSRSACPIVVIDLADRPDRGLVALDRAHRDGRDPMVLVLDPLGWPGVGPLARELGATHVISGLATPPVVVDLLAQWLPLARRRGEADGWAADPEPRPEPWDPAFLTPAHRD